MPKISAGLLMYRRREGRIEILLVHPGGPFFRKKDAGAWSIPKGEAAEGEDLLQAAQREFREETGIVPAGPFTALAPVRQKSGKIVYAWSFAGDCDAAACTSNTFTVEWPPKSGRQTEFPEVDRAEFFELSIALEKINAAQAEFVTGLRKMLAEI